MQEAYGGRISWLSPLPLSAVRGDGGSFPDAAAAAGSASDSALQESMPPGLGHAADGAADSVASSEAGGVAGSQQRQGGRSTRGQADQQQLQTQNGVEQAKPQRQLLGLPFEGVDVAADGPRLHVGDDVEFRVTLDPRSGQLKATEVRQDMLASVERSTTV